MSKPNAAVVEVMVHTQPQVLMSPFGISSMRFWPKFHKSPRTDSLVAADLMPNADHYNSNPYRNGR